MDKRVSPELKYVLPSRVAMRLWSMTMKPTQSVRRMNSLVTTSADSESILNGPRDLESSDLLAVEGPWKGPEAESSTEHSKNHSY